MILFGEILLVRKSNRVLKNYQPGINDVIHGREPLPDPEADPPEGDDVGEEGVPHDVPPHHPATFVLTVK